MIDVCRFCLTMPDKKMRELTEDSDILLKIWTSMSIQICINKLLPKKVCMNCTEKINETYEFHKEITQSEYKLLNYLKNEEELEKNYSGFKNSEKSKDVQPENDNFSNSNNLNHGHVINDNSDQSTVPSRPEDISSSDSDNLVIDDDINNPSIQSVVPSQPEDHNFSKPDNLVINDKVINGPSIQSVVPSQPEDEKFTDSDNLVIDAVKNNPSNQLVDPSQPEDGNVRDSDNLFLRNVTNDTSTVSVVSSQSEDRNFSDSDISNLDDVTKDPSHQSDVLSHTEDDNFSDTEILNLEDTTNDPFNQSDIPSQTEDTNFSNTDNKNLDSAKNSHSNQSLIGPSVRIMNGVIECSPLRSVKKTNNKKRYTPITDIVASKTKNKKSKLKKCSEINTNISDGKEYMGIEKWSCLTCSTYCYSQADLFKHYEMVHTDNGSINNEDSSIENIDSEMTEYNEIIAKNSKLDLKHYVSSKACEKKQEDKNDRPYVCKICARTYKTVYEIVRHGRAHNGYKFYCSFKCGFNTAYKAALKEHEKRRHGKAEFKYTCDKCGKGFQVKTWYEQHQNMHTNVKPFICDSCGLAFHLHRYLTAHFSTAHPQMSSVKRYKCTECLLPCDSRKSLTLHMEEHGVKTSLLCDICGKMLSSAEQLKYHTNVHLGVKPYSCSICNKRFTKKFNMKQHEHTHTGERTHACNMCGKFYTQRSALLRHIKSQHQERKTARPKKIY